MSRGAAHKDDRSNVLTLALLAFRLAADDFLRPVFFEPFFDLGVLEGELSPVSKGNVGRRVEVVESAAEQRKKIWGKKCSARTIERLSIQNGREPKGFNTAPMVHARSRGQARAYGNNVRAKKKQKKKKKKKKQSQPPPPLCSPSEMSRSLTDFFRSRPERRTILETIFPGVLLRGLGRSQKMKKNQKMQEKKIK